MLQKRDNYRMRVKAQRDGRPLDGLKLGSYFSLFVDQSTPIDVRILLKETLKFAALFLINDVDILLCLRSAV